MKPRYNTDTLAIQALQSRYAFTNALSYYFEGKSGTPEAMEQKAYLHCLMAEFPKELGRVEIPQKNTPDMPKEIYTRLVVSVANFYDANPIYTNKGKRVSLQMKQFHAMGYQDGTLDVGVMYPCNGHHAFWCEMKHPGGHYTAKGNIADPGKPSKEQRITIDDLKSVGYYACVGVGFLDALGHWLTYLGY